MVVKGKDLRIFIAERASSDPTRMALKSVYHSTECSATFETTFSRIVTKQTHGGEDYLPERLTWGCAGSGLIVESAEESNDFKAIFDYWRLRKKVSVAFKMNDNYESPFTISGQAYIENIDAQAPAHGNASMSFQLRCVGVPNMRIIPPDVVDPFRIFDETFNQTFN